MVTARAYSVLFTILLVAVMWPSVTFAAEPAKSPFAPGQPLEPWQPERRILPTSVMWFEGHYGWNTPLGSLGAAADLQLAPWFIVNLGAGIRDVGGQFASAARFPVLTSDTLRIGVGGGYSVGPYRWDNQDFDTPPDKTNSEHRDWAHWSNLQLSFGSSAVPYAWRTYVGYSKLLNGGTGLWFVGGSVRFGVEL